MTDAVLKQLKHDILKNIKADVAKLLTNKEIPDLTVKCNGSNADNSCIEIYLSVTFENGITKPIVITIDNYVIIPNMCTKLDRDAKIPEKHYYPPAVGEIRKEVSDLNRARLRILWVIWKSLLYYYALALLGDSVSEWKELIKHKNAVVEVDTVGEIKYSYND